MATGLFFLTSFSDKSDPILVPEGGQEDLKLIASFRILDIDGSALDYSNGGDIFNAGQKVQIQVRAIQIDDGVDYTEDVATNTSGLVTHTLQ